VAVAGIDLVFFAFGIKRFRQSIVVSR
jgi:hypothetical protein